MNGKALYLTAIAAFIVGSTYIVATAEDTGKGSQTTVIPAVAPVQDRELTAIENQELAGLEMDFANGEITESEYNQRKRDLYRSTLPDDETLDDGVLNQHRSF